MGRKNRVVGKQVGTPFGKSYSFSSTMATTVESSQELESFDDLQTQLLQEACFQNNPDAVKDAISNNADIYGYTMNNELNTALHICAKVGSIACATVLLEHSVQSQCDIILSWNSDCKTPLSLAVDNKQNKFAEFLKGYPFQRNMKNETYDQRTTWGSGAPSAS